jgi:GNAT superfamily N-acetyltransferase
MAHLRPFEPSDSIEAITLLLHRAYASLGSMGLNYTAVDQSPDVTAMRIRRGTCYVATDGADFVGTIVAQPTQAESECFHYTQPGVACVNQFAVAPEYQCKGLGSKLLLCAEFWARKNGFLHLAVDTAEPATHLIEFYNRRGYRHVDWVQWSGKTYRSVVLRKSLDDITDQCSPFRNQNG